MSLNENVDINFIKNNKDKNWSNKYLGMKEFKTDLKKEQDKIIEKFVIKIQRWWIDIYYNPRSRVRQKILNKQFDEYQKFI